MAKKPWNPKPYKTLDVRADESLGKTAHSVFNPEDFKIMNFSGNVLQNDWTGEPVIAYKLARPTLVSRGWRVFFTTRNLAVDTPRIGEVVYQFFCPLPMELTEEEANLAATNLMDVINMKRRGA